ncbi:MAG: pilus assembly protein [Methylobacteriaceae bacterium]|nr:pilus assembly protein [Methylobacteriaceae bacterium]
MLPALRNGLLRFRSDARGAAAVEFGFVGVMFITGILNAFEVGRFAYEKMQVENAAYAGAQAAWKTCDFTMLPATQMQTATQTTKCPNLNTAVTAAIQATSLGSKVALSSAGITEAYYCVNTSGTLQSVGSVSSKSANCSAAGNANVSPADYIQVNVTFSYTPLLPMTVMGVHGASTITKTSWMRLG